MPRYYRIPLGICNSYLITNNRQCILVDAGTVGREKQCIDALNRLGFDCSAIGLIVITHVHYDHVGSLRALKEACQCPVAVHQKEAHLLKSGEVVLPAGTNMTGKSLMMVGNMMLRIHPQFFSFSPVEAEITVTGEMSLEPFGISGSIIPTPGHTEGSLSIVLSTGEAFVGDLAINYLPFSLGPIFPPFADNADNLLESWKNLLDRGVIKIFPAHGGSFPAQKLREKMIKRSL
ncbi:MAG: MBL fold metallo-hydrolase [Deltaproteobacteria bacterium]|nr:MBL fold metallo-hydrolase [Deltaproteobacteria bacterium]